MMTRRTTRSWWSTPLSPRQGVDGSDFDRPISLLAMTLAGIAGVVALGLNPVIATAYVEFLGFSEAQAGYIVAADMSGTAIGTLLVSARVHIWNRRVTAVCGLAILLVGNLACLALAAFDSLLIVRFIIGTGAGIAAGSMAAGIAATGNPDRYFGVYTVVTLSTGALLMALAPRLLISFGIGGQGAGVHHTGNRRPACSRAIVRGGWSAGACCSRHTPGPNGADNVFPACFYRLSPGAAHLRQQAGVRTGRPVIHVRLADVFPVPDGYCFGA